MPCFLFTTLYPFLSLLIISTFSEIFVVIMLLLCKLSLIIFLHCYSLWGWDARAFAGVGNRHGTTAAVCVGIERALEYEKRGRLDEVEDILWSNVRILWFVLIVKQERLFSLFVVFQKCFHNQLYFRWVFPRLFSLFFLEMYLHSVVRT